MRNLLTARSAIIAALLAAFNGPALAQTELPHPTYTWSLSPMSGDWNTPANWRPEGVPDTQAEKAAFGSSSVTNVTASPYDILGSLEFTPGASQYTINGSLYFNRGGVFNNSGVVQTFNGSFGFDKGATAGDLVTYNVTGSVGFSDGGNAGTATFNLTGYGASFSGGPSAISSAGSATFNNSGTISFRKLSNAGEATFINYGGDSFGAPGAEIDFTRSNADSSTIILYGGSVFGAHGARLSFTRSSASSATLIANGGAGPASAASILFTNSSGGNARVEVFGNGNIDFSRREVANNTIGSLEGNGFVYLGAGTLAIGGNNINTTFAGTITDQGGVHQGGPGSISKTGTGTLTLTSANDYSAGTTVESGSLFVNNTTGSATGSGPVNVVGGTLAGAGTITGPLTVGNGSSGATLAPGANSSTIGTLTVQGALNFAANSSYEAQLNSTALAADNVTANGVTISSDAQITLTDLGATTLPDGTSFTLIDNTSGAAIGGTFSNLEDGAMIAIGSNTYQANYEGGDGNDLTLTVVPGAPVAQSAFSRKTHGGAGTFDVPLPLSGSVGVECRSGGATNDYQMIINFATSVTVESASVTSGAGSVSSFSVSGSQVTVNLTGVTNVQTITVTLHNVNDGTSTGDVPVSMGVLVGDVNGNAAVNASDVSLTKSQVGVAVSGSNFREDVNANGAINSVDVAQVKANVGTALPP